MFVGDTGADIVGRQTLDFMRANHVGTDYCPMRPDMKSAVSLAYLDDNGDASYVFYKQKPEAPKEWTLPQIDADDVLLYGSYFASCQGMRPLVEDMLSRGSHHLLRYQLPQQPQPRAGGAPAHHRGQLPQEQHSARQCR